MFFLELLEINLGITVKCYSPSELCTVKRDKAKDYVNFYNIVIFAKDIFVVCNARRFCIIESNLQSNKTVGFIYNNYRRFPNMLKPHPARCYIVIHW